ncbi:MAG: HipA domain-containing protein [Microthrixaceae bacterium]
MTDHLELRHGPTVIGVLERSSGSSVTLRYSNEVLDSVETGRIVVSCSAPVQQAPVNVTAWCRGLLPEGQHLHALAARADVAASDTFGLLRRYGRDIAGAFEIVTVDPPPRDPDIAIYGPGELDAAILNLEDEPLGIADDSELSLAGLQDKMTAVRIEDRWARPIHGYPSTHILKVDSATHRGIVAAEAACLRLALAVGLTTIDASVTVVGDRDVLIVPRYDRSIERNGTVVRLHQEDLLQALGVNPADRRERAKYQHSSSAPSWWHCADLLDSYSDNWNHEVSRLIAAMTFTTAIGNGDCHAKNVSLMINDGTVTLAPLYDTVPTMLWPALRDRAALWVNDVRRNSAITGADLVEEAVRFRVPVGRAASAVEDTLEEMTANLRVLDHEEAFEAITANIDRLRRSL